MCCRPRRMGMISSRQSVLSRTSGTTGQSSRSWGSKAVRIGRLLEDCLTRVQKRRISGETLQEAYDLRGASLAKTREKRDSNTLSDGHELDEVLWKRLPRPKRRGRIETSARVLSR